MLSVGDLLCVDWTQPRSPWDGSLMFVFDGGILTADDTDRFQLAPDGEMAGWVLVPVGELAGSWRRVRRGGCWPASPTAAAERCIARTATHSRCRAVTSMWLTMPNRQGPRRAPAAETHHLDP